MGGKHFTVPCTISRNGYGIDLNALADTGANGFAFIDTACAIDVAKFLNIKATRLEKPISVKGFDGRRGKAATHILILHLTLDGRRQTDIPFCILDLGNHDMILGLKWMEYFDIWLNPRSRRLIWPDDDDRLSPPSFHREIRTHRQALSPRNAQPTHQQDVKIRDQAFALEDVRRRAGAQSIPIFPGPGRGNIEKPTKHQSVGLAGEASDLDDSGYESATSVVTDTGDVTPHAGFPPPGRGNT